MRCVAVSGVAVEGVAMEVWLWVCDCEAWLWRCGCGRCDCCGRCYLYEGIVCAASDHFGTMKWFLSW